MKERRTLREWLLHILNEDKAKSVEEIRQQMHRESFGFYAFPKEDITAELERLAGEALVVSDAQGRYTTVGDANSPSGGTQQ